jgi:hypothetical protein
MYVNTEMLLDWLVQYLIILYQLQALFNVKQDERTIIYGEMGRPLSKSFSGT